MQILKENTKNIYRYIVNRSWKQNGKRQRNTHTYICIYIDNYISDFSVFFWTNISASPSPSSSSFPSYVIRRGACKPCTFSMGGQCVAPGGPQSCRPRELAKRCVSRCAMLKPPLPSNCVSTIITCLQVTHRELQGIKIGNEPKGEIRRLTSAVAGQSQRSWARPAWTPRCSSPGNRTWHESTCSHACSPPSQPDQPSPAEREEKGRDIWLLLLFDAMIFMSLQRETEASRSYSLSLPSASPWSDSRRSCPRDPHAAVPWSGWDWWWHPQVDVARVLSAPPADAWSCVWPVCTADTDGDPRCPCASDWRPDRRANKCPARASCGSQRSHEPAQAEWED